MSKALLLLAVLALGTGVMAGAQGTAPDSVHGGSGGSTVGVQTVRRLATSPPAERLADANPGATFLPLGPGAAGGAAPVPGDRTGSSTSASPTPSLTTSLDTAVQTALQRSPTIIAFAERVSAAREVLARTRSARGLQVRVSADALLYDELPNSKKQMLGSGDTDLLVSLDASRVLYSNLLTGQIDAATANALTTLRQFQRAQQEVRYQTIAAYYEVQRSLKRRDADAQAEKAMQAHAELTQKMFQVGKVPELDVLRVQVQLADLRQRLVVSENAVNLALARLRNVMGISDQEALSVEPPAENLVVELVPVEPEEELLTRAYEQRPEIAAAQAQISRAEAEQRQAAAGKQPEVRAVGSYYREGTSPSLDYKDWYVGVRLSMPLHDSGATQHGVKAAQANQRAAEADLEATRQRVRLDVHEAWLGVREATERIAATQTAVQQATRALEIERKRYELGMNTILDVLDTQTAMTRAQYNFIDAYYAYHTALAKLHLAVADPDGAAPATTVQAGGRLP